MAESTSIYCAERGYMEIPVDVYTGLVERSERLAVYEELMRGYNPVTLILAGKKQVRKKQRKEERQERERAAEEYRAALEGIKEYVAVPACPDPGKLVSLINAGFTKFDIAEEFKTDAETVDIWVSHLAARAEDAPGEAEAKPAEEKPAEAAPAEEASAADPAPAKNMPGSFQAYSGSVTEKKRPGRPRAKIRKDV